MRKILAFFVLSLCLLLSVGFITVSATSTYDMGYVEYQTEASINFEEVIEVVLTNKDTGNYYTQRLHRVNDYVANTSVPVGVYSVSAQIINVTGTLFSEYSLVCLTDEIEVSNSNTASVVSFRVDQFVGGDVSDSTDYENWEDEDWESYLDPSVPGATEADNSTTGDPEQETSPAEQNNTNELTRGSRSMVVSAIISVVVFGAIGLALFFIKNKRKS